MNSYQLKRDHANKRRRDKEKAKTKVMAHIDSAMLTKHAVARARQRSVSVNDIKQAFKNGTFERCGTTTYKVKTKTTSIVFDCHRRSFDSNDQYNNTASVITVWAGPSKNRKAREQKRIRTGREMRRIANQKKQQKREAKRRKRKERKRKNQGDPASASS